MNNRPTVPSKRQAELNARLLRALGNPERQQIMVILRDRPATPKELSEETGMRLEVTGRHCRALCADGLIDLIETDQRRGGKQHIYRASVRPYLSLEMWEQLPQPVREMHSASIAQDGVDELAAAMAAGTFDSVTNNANVRTPLVVDEEGMTQIAKAVEEFSDLLIEIEADSANRLARTGSEGMNVLTWLLAYPAASARPDR